jgi:hypothetical protein
MINKQIVIPSGVPPTHFHKTLFWRREGHWYCDLSTLERSQIEAK